MQDITLTSRQHLKAYSPNEVFFCPEESLFYSQCLDKMVLGDCTSLDTVVEFGSGDGSPVINSLLNNSFNGFIQGYELNETACELGRSRIEKYELGDKYAITNRCFFQNCPADTTYLVANPPYLPAPDDQLYMPSLHGGKDGSIITRRLLGVGCEKVMLMISAYSNPIDTIDHANLLGYKVIDFMVAPLKFGYYSCEPKVRETIEKLKAANKAFYSGDVYLLAGVLFKKDCPPDLDISAEFLKVMTAL
ncbi:MAG: hypothetical protein N5P05_000724 [Chroococcopsis gigantea SAG 12.99]|jgi:hypothetical protein|nr:SAM-dependent methyltransferase [Chlorogloea purpurea SAG 13.99]MDV2999118.1 hypothetical protein [Chroococcopsis gigantea SAG 12.99]